MFLPWRDVDGAGGAVCKVSSVLASTSTETYLLHTLAKLASFRLRACLCLPEQKQVEQVTSTLDFNRNGLASSWAVLSGFDSTRDAPLSLGGTRLGSSTSRRRFASNIFPMALRLWQCDSYRPAVEKRRALAQICTANWENEVERIVRQNGTAVNMVCMMRT